MTEFSTVKLLADRLEKIGPSPMMLLARKASEMRSAGRPVISLATGEPDFNTPEHIQEAARAAMANGETHYTYVDGTDALKNSVRNKFMRENGLDFSMEEVCVASGGKHIIFNAMSATLNAGDEVVFGYPTYPSYVDAILFAEGVPVGIPTTSESGFKLNVDQLAAKVNERTKWLILNSPSNPAGSLYSLEELEEIGNFILSRRNVHVLCDDIYEHIIFDGLRFCTLANAVPKLRSRILTLNGVSKAYSMTGWRIGYATASPDLIKGMATIQSLSTSCPNSVSQAAAVAALDGPQDVVKHFRDIFARRRELVSGLIQANKMLDLTLPSGAFYVFPSCRRAIGRRTPSGNTIATDVDFAKYILDAADVAIVPGSIFGSPGYFRASFACADADLTTSFKRINIACDLLE